MADLIHVGDVLFDPITGHHIKVVEQRSDGFVTETTVEPRPQKGTLNHLHTRWTEKFEILSGAGRYYLDGKEYDAPTGHTYTVMQGQAHIHPWNPSKDELHFRQTDTFLPADNTASEDTWLAFSTFFGLIVDGKSKADGAPKNFFQLMVTSELLRQHGGYVATAPTAVQDIMIPVSAAVGRALGYRPWYEQYLPSAMAARR